MVDLRDISQVKSTVKTLKFRKANFQFFKELVDGTPWETALKDKGAEQSWKLFKNIFLRAQDTLITMHKKSGKEGRPAWLSKDLLVELKYKRGMHRQWKQGHTSWEGCQGTARKCRDGNRKAKTQLELTLARDVKNNEKSFHRYVAQKRKTREIVPPQ